MSISYIVAIILLLFINLSLSKNKRTAEIRSKIFSLHDIILGSALSLVRQEVFDHKEYNNSSVISNAGNETGSLLYLLYLFCML
jgi:hypothetical protein